jgi:membrane protease YdiL (CAAX protease family)
MVNEVINEAQYRLKPNLKNALLIVFFYTIYIFLMMYFSGVPYTDFGKSSSNMLHGVLIPVAIGSLLLTIVAVWSGWWKDVWRDKYHIKGHNWMYIFVVLAVISIIGNFLKGNIGSLDTMLIFTIFVATAFVGYSEELLTRGLLIRGARGSGLSEVKVFLIVMLVFGLFHGINFLLGQAAVTTLQQMFLAGLAGGVYYAIFRKTGFLVVTMVLHALFDFSLLTQSMVQSALMAILVSGVIYLSYILLLPAARNFNVKKTIKKETNT